MVVERVASLPTWLWNVRDRRWLLVVGVIGAAAFALGVRQAPAVAFCALLTSGYYFLTIALGAVVFLALMALSSAAWHAPLKRLPEALSSYLPWGAATMLLLLAGLRTIYPWARHLDGEEAAIIAAKKSYLNADFFTARMVVFLVLWITFAWLIRRASRAQDGDRSLRHTKRTLVLSVGFVLVFAYSFCLASVDWLMSLEPNWSSTVFGFYNITGLLVSSLAAITVGAIVLRRRGVMPWLNENHLHDLGKLLLAMVTFWAYLWFCQFMLIWYTNLPEETSYYLLRTRNGWAVLFYLNLVLNWLVPFVALLPRTAKRSERRLLWISGIVLVARWLDVYLMATPGNFAVHPRIGWVDIGTFGAVGALFLLVVWRALERAPLLPQGDPYLDEGLHLRQ